MTPIQRISEKSQCLSVLGLSAKADLSDVRRAYKNLILEKHPDHGSGTTDDICQITDAYRFLKANADELGMESPSARVTSVRPRPSVKSTETVFSESVLDECRAHFSDENKDGQHVATMLHRTGRSLTYFVPTKPAEGANEVVVATGELVDARHAVPQMVTFDNRDLFTGVYAVPENICADCFPGARAVQIRFAK